MLKGYFYQRVIYYFWVIKADSEHEILSGQFELGAIETKVF